MQVTAKTRLQYRIQLLIFILLFSAVIGLLAWISLQYNIRTDWTAGKRNSLSDATIELLKTIDGPVDIRSYQLDDPSLQRAVTEILQRYQQHKPDLSFRLLNPDLEIHLAKEDNIERYGQTMISYNKKQQLVDSLNEQNVSNALIRLSRINSPTVRFSHGHGERDPGNNANTGYSIFKQKLLEKGFIVEPINLLSDTLTVDNILIIAAPSKALLETETSKIINFIQQGGHLLWLQDPGEPHGLDPIAHMLGLEFTPGVMVDNNPNLKETLRIQHPAMLPILSYHPHDITRDMRYNTLFPIAKALQQKANQHWSASPLLQSLPSSWSETDGFALDVKLEPEKGDITGPHNLAYAFEGKDNNQPRIIVIGDSDFLANSYIGAGANLLLGINMMNWLSENDQLIAINPKTAPDLKLDLDDTQVAIIGIGFLVILPLGLLASGVLIWLQRRKQ